jgi:hypothetical protein
MLDATAEIEDCPRRTQCTRQQLEGTTNVCKGAAYAKYYLQRGVYEVAVLSIVYPYITCIIDHKQ